ncbi:MAG TPA: cupin domain-containing protein [Mycobacteriales bacterium]|nr:cupin domain-containing protein [Mycobacteriales bacterium]
MGIAHGGGFVPMDDDPDDYRPTSSWQLQVDPDGRASFGVIRERIGVGDRIPRHWHDVDEVVLYESGTARVHLDGTETEVSAGATAFIPAGAVHGTVNIGADPVELRAVFATTAVRMDMVERNAMPGTEDAPPRATRYDFATGEFTVLGDAATPRTH